MQPSEYRKKVTDSLRESGRKYMAKMKLERDKIPPNSTGQSSARDTSRRNVQEQSILLEDSEHPRLTQLDTTPLTNMLSNFAHCDDFDPLNLTKDAILSSATPKGVSFKNNDDCKHLASNFDNIVSSPCTNQRGTRLELDNYYTFGNINNYTAINCHLTDRNKTRTGIEKAWNNLEVPHCDISISESILSTAEYSYGGHFDDDSFIEFIDDALGPMDENYEVDDTQDVSFYEF
jgi:hypothetical protein